MAKTTVLSLGAGVQSSVLLLMSCMGELPRLDAAIFADTRWETPAVYDHLEWLEMQAKTAGIPVYRVSAGSLPERVLAWQTGADDPRAEFLLPLHTATGMMRRQCTTAYKIEPIEACIRGATRSKKRPARSYRIGGSVARDQRG